jgi:putative drug exporter of the RND superfamily
VTALNTARRAVFFAGITVCIALLGQFALGLSFLYGVAVSASVTEALTMLASSTLLPALLGFIGMKVFSRRQRAKLQATGPVDETVTGWWYRWARLIERRPVLPAAVALGTVVAIALPISSLHLGLDDAGSDPPGTTTLAAYDLLAKGFGPGFSGPLELVAKLPSPVGKTAFVDLTHNPGAPAWGGLGLPAGAEPERDGGHRQLVPLDQPPVDPDRGPAEAAPRGASSPKPRRAPASPSWSGGSRPLRPISLTSCRPSSSCSSPSSWPSGSCCSWRCSAAWSSRSRPRS